MEFELQGKCKICGSDKLSIFDHTAQCGACGVLLYYPYPTEDADLVETGAGKSWSYDDALAWYRQSAYLNHDNFTSMLRFTVSEADRSRPLDVLDYGGGGGQFALVCKSHLPDANVYVTDISDESLLEPFRSVNVQISFRAFIDNQQTFDIIFMNDVFEHLSNPAETLAVLGRKLKPGGKIFIDTPKQFWLYPVAKAVYPKLYSKILRGTVSWMHLQIWSPAAFRLVIASAGLKIKRYEECSEYTMLADFYMNNMGITNPVIRIAGKVFYANARRLAKNKILCVLST